MGDLYRHHTLWGCEDVNNRGLQLEDLILKNYLILFNDKHHTYFHSATSFVFHLFFLTSPGKLVPTLVEETTFPSCWRTMDLLVLKGFKDKSCQREIGINSSTRLHQSAIAYADGPLSLFTSILKDIVEETILKTSAVPKHSINHGFLTFANRALERFKHEPTEVNLNAYRIARANARRDVRLSQMH